jgi:hypothetical protein
MIWGAVGSNFKGPLHFVHDGKTVDWASSHDEIIVRSGLPDAADQVFGAFNWVLMQHNTRPHLSKAMMAALSNRAVELLANWPPDSPDLNIIEVIWAIMKRRVESQQPWTLAELKHVILEVWENLSVVTINGLIAQMPLRVAKVIEGNRYTMFHEISRFSSVSSVHFFREGIETF